MNVKYFFMLLLFSFCRISFPSVSSAQAFDYDVIVAGGGTGGIMAAIQAARGGAKVAVFEPSSWIGGQMTAAGVSTMDDLSRQKSGLYLDFINRVNKYYDDKGKSTGTCYWDSRSIAFEPKVGEKILYEMLDEARSPNKRTRAFKSKAGETSGNDRTLDVFLNSSIIEVHREGRKITGIKALVKQNNSGEHFYKNEMQVACKVLIDATEYGDMIPLANLPYRAGNSRSPFIKLDESMIQDITWTAVIKYYPLGAPRDLIAYTPLPGYDEAKRNYESYVIVDGNDFKGVYPVDLPVNLISHNAYRAIPDSSNYFSYDGNRQNWQYVTKTGVNWGNDYPGKSGWNSGSSGLPAKYLEDISFRNKMNKEAFIRTLHFIYYLQNELGDYGSRWSVADDEYYNDIPSYIVNDIPSSWHEIAKRMPVIPYVRESRRIIGERTLSSSELLKNSLSYRDGETNAEFQNAIAIGGYPLDLHHASNNGDFEWEFGESNSSIASNRPRGAFQVPLDIMIPKDADGFLAVEKNLSISRLAAGALRLQPISMMTGQAAGALAALAVNMQMDLREVPAIKVQSLLVKHGVNISLCKYSDVPPESPFFGAVQISNLYGLFEPQDFPHAPSYNISDLDDPKLAMAILRGADKGVFGVDEMISNEEVENSVKKTLKALSRDVYSLKPINNPKKIASKADFARYLTECFGFSDYEAKSKEQFYSDVPPEHRSFDSVNILLDIGALEPAKGAKFNPAQPITRGEAVQILVRAFEFASVWKKGKQ